MDQTPSSHFVMALTSVQEVLLVINHMTNEHERLIFRKRSVPDAFWSSRMRAPSMIADSVLFE
jgi:hypothetical protein